jgi:histidinol-phosphate aminotransferase
VLLMRTLSKFGLAGVRIGYMMGPKALIAEVDKVRPPYNISVLNYECALFALEHQEVFAAQAGDSWRSARVLFDALAGIAHREGLEKRRQHDPGAGARCGPKPSRA